MCDIKQRYDAMYEFENISCLYDFKFKDIKLPMWLFVRSLVIEAAAYNKGYNIKKKYLLLRIMKKV